MEIHNIRHPPKLHFDWRGVRIHASTCEGGKLIGFHVNETMVHIEVETILNHDTMRPLWVATLVLKPRVHVAFRRKTSGTWKVSGRR